MNNIPMRGDALTLLFFKTLLILGEMGEAWPGFIINMLKSERVGKNTY